MDKYYLLHRFISPATEDFSGKQQYCADMSIVIRTYTWAMVETVNIDVMERDNSKGSVPVVNAVRASEIEQLGLFYDG